MQLTVPTDITETESLFFRGNSPLPPPWARASSST